MNIPGGNPWGPRAAGNPFLAGTRPVIADLAIAALKDRESKRRRRICPQFNPNRSLFLLSKRNPIRRYCLMIVDAKPFEFFILATILANCIALAINHPYPMGDYNATNVALEKTELVFLIIFTTEAVLKIIAYGFVLHPDAYLRNFWNVLDFSIVVIGLGSKCLENTKLDVKSLRAFRVLRPLRLVSGLPSLQVVLNSIVTAMVPLFHIFLLVIFLIIIYAIIGLELFQSKLHATCYLVQENTTYGLRSITEPCSNCSLTPPKYVCALDDTMMDNPRPCSNSSYSMAFNCSEIGPNYVCRDLPPELGERYVGPEDGLVNFDNFLYAMLTVFTCVTMEGWTTFGAYIAAAVGHWWPWIYFVSLILLGSFFVMNLVLGVLSGEFTKEKDKTDRKELFRKERQQKREQQDYENYKEWIEIAGLMDGKIVEDQEATNEPTARSQCCEGMRRLKKFRKRLRRVITAFVKSRQFFALILTFVFLNTIVLVTEHHNQPLWLNQFQSKSICTCRLIRTSFPQNRGFQSYICILSHVDFANVLFVSLFTLEMIIKMCAYGIQDYFATLFNRYDFFVVVVSILEIILTYIGVIDPMGLSVLRCARLLRIFKITHYWAGLRGLVNRLLKSIKSVAGLLLLLFLFILICSLLGMQWFGGTFNFPNTDKPRSHFDGIAQSMITVFQMLTGEDWNAVMYNGMRAYKADGPLFAFVVIYFVIVFVVGNYILLNVFLAIAVDNLSDEDEDDEEGGMDDDNDVDDHPGSSAAAKKAAEAAANAKGPLDAYMEMNYEEVFAEEEEPDDGNLASKLEQMEINMANPQTIPPYSAFFIFDPTNKFRIFCHNIVSSPIFTNLVLACILISSALLCAEDPLNTYSLTNRILNYFDYFFTSVFTIEITLKMIAHGFIMHEGAFLRSMFNLLDLIVVFVALISFMLENEAISAVKILRVLRVLRPLRAINRAKGLKNVVQCVVTALKSIGNIMLVTVLIEFVFAVIGVQLFKGKYVSCNDPSKLTEQDCKGFFIEYEHGRPADVVERVWTHSELNFDNVANAMLTLFVVLTFEGWPPILYAGIDSNEEDMGPLQDHRKYIALYFIIYLIVASFFMVNIFVGFVIVTFQREGEREYKNCELNKNQRKCIEYALKARPRRRYIPKGHLQYKIWSMVVSRKMEITIFTFIFLNTVTLACKHDKMDPTFSSVLDNFNYFFTAVFTVEFILKLSAFSFRHYFGDPWNVIDFIIVLGSYIDIIVSKASSETTLKFNINFFRLFRVMRLVKLLSKEESIRKLLWTFIKSLQALPYVALLIAMLFFIYAVIGMQLFGKISLHQPGLALGEDGVIHRSNNFRNFFFALLVLFRSATGESWQEIMLACTPGRKCAVDSEDGSEGMNCGSNLAYPYFITFYLFCSFVIINLFVAVIMDNFDYLTRDWSILGPHHLDEFVTRWAEYDPEAKGRVRHLDVVTMLGKISPPLGFGSMCPHTRACHKLVQMNMPLQSDGTVFFNATLFALVRRNLRIKVPEDDEKEKSLDQLNEELRIVIKKIWKRTSPKLLDQILPPKELDVVTVGKFYATFLIQNWFREWQKRKMIQKDTRYIPQILAGDRSMPHQPTIVGFPRRCSSDLTGDDIQRRKGEKRDVIPGGGILGRTLTDWTRKRGKKHISSGHRDITEDVSELRKRQLQAGGGAGGAGASVGGGGPNGLPQPGGQMPAIQVTAAHPAVIAVATLGDKKIKTTIPAPSAEEKGGGGIMGLIRRGSSYLRRKGAEEQQQRQKEERKEDLEIARSMFAAARRESYYAHRAD
uniref:Voltage-dependent L-type calcium channel subunit alpha n=1 Tax=Echinococcus granulosus TaxID=6210 RepID=A0A068X255_ECHGR|nr:voltage dependent calcium channel alpha 1 [Echinococcus granulosus]